ncbi:MAG: type III pantothenate kinase, partial [Chloroflexota bacterium]
VIIAGVVPAAVSSVREAVERYLTISPLIVSPELDLGIEVRYHTPAGVGADRIANAVAARQLYGSPAIVVDFGTGTNFDVIDAAGRYAGGSIAPGLEIATAALFSSTSLLPQVPLVAPPAAIGDSTIHSLQSGIIFGYAGLVDGIVRRISKELGAAPHVIATGGLAEVVAEHAETVQHINMDLTLYGLYQIYDRNARRHADSVLRQDQPFP